MDACTRRETVSTNDPDEPTAVYCYQQGTSMAAAHVSGVAALVLSRWANATESVDGRSQLDGVRSLLYQSADPVACPSTGVLAMYAPYVALDNGVPQTCQGSATYNAWYGFGEVNALTSLRAAEHNSNRSD
jgi:subtilisin family serine protease